MLPDAPFISLPLAASLEQLVGTLDLENVLRDGQVQFLPGLIARAHGGILYVDEVNLLPDALVDALLDVAASGVNVIERDGISQRHAARFVLIGTMNPEEGELRPQLLDRFGLSVTLGNPDSPQLRQAIVRTRLAFEHQPQAMLDEYAQMQAQLQQQVVAARATLPHIGWNDAVIERATQWALAAGVDGLRADLVLVKAARAHAALAGCAEVGADDVDAVADLALAHRRLYPPDATVPPAKPSGANSPQHQATAPPASSAEAPNHTGHSGHTANPGAEAHAAPQAAPADASSVQPAPDGDWGALPVQPQAMSAIPMPVGLASKHAPKKV